MLLTERYAKVDGEIYEAQDLNAEERSLFAALAYHFNHTTGRCDPSLVRLEKCSGLARSTLIRRLETLEAKGFIRRERRINEFQRPISNSYNLKGYAPSVLLSSTAVVSESNPYSVRVTPRQCQGDTQTENINIKREQRKPEHKNSGSVRVTLPATKRAQIFTDLDKLKEILALEEVVL